MDHSAHDHGVVHQHGDTDMDGSECVFHHALVFHVGVCQEILFPGWRTHDALQVFLSALALFVAGLLYEGLKYVREAQHLRARTHAADSQVNINKTNECGNANCGQTTVVKYTMLSSGHIIQTLLHIVQTSCSYILMLVFMTYNVWLCMGLVLGMALGYFIFGWRKVTVVDPNEHCH